MVRWGGAVNENMATEETGPAHLDQRQPQFYGYPMAKQPIDHPGAMAILVNALEHPDISAPELLQPAEQAFFRDLVAEFSLHELSEHKIALITMIARTMQLVAQEQDLVAQEGTLVPTSQGVKSNPRIGAINQSLNSILKLRRALGLGNYKLSEKAVARERAKEIEGGAVAAAKSSQLFQSRESYQKHQDKLLGKPKKDLK